MDKNKQTVEKIKLKEAIKSGHSRDTGNQIWTFQGHGQSSLDIPGISLNKI
jgi:hypothetical protein